jgi:hypothetical protein
MDAAVRVEHGLANFQRESGYFARDALTRGRGGVPGPTKAGPGPRGAVGRFAPLILELLEHHPLHEDGACQDKLRGVPVCRGTSCASGMSSTAQPDQTQILLQQILSSSTTDCLANLIAPTLTASGDDVALVLKGPK